MKKLGLILLVLLMAAGSVFANGGSETAAPAAAEEATFSGDYAFGGSTTLEPIIMAAIESFKEMYPDAKISYDAQGSSAGVKGVIAGTYTLGGASRDLKDSEVEQGAKATPIALDGVAVVVNKESVGIDNLEMSQLIAIYAGEVTNWSEVGGADAEIVVFNRDEASGTRSCFDDATVGTVKKDFTDTAAIVTSNGDMVSKVGATPNSIGYCGFGYIGKDAGTKTVSVDGVAPEIKYVLDLSYSVQRKLNVVYTDIKAGSLEEAFLNYLLSDEGQEIAKEEKFIPLQ